MQASLDSQGPVASPFRDLGLPASLCRAVAAAGYTTPTPIQTAAIPIVLDGGDLIACAQTGSGKTAAFALPIIHRLLSTPRREGHRGVRALVLAPTRELAAQIGDCFAKYAKGSPLRHLVVFGGVNKNPQVRALAHPPDVLVACPGRLLDLMMSDGFRLKDVEVVVLDEADRMLDMGFIHDVRKVMSALPTPRQTLLFSATMPREISELAERFLVKPQRVAVDPVSSTAGPIQQSVYFVDSQEKQTLLASLLGGSDVERALVFTRTKHGANRVAEKLERAGIPAQAIHGNKSQSARERAMDGFRSGAIRVVVATDLASRGIDVKHLSHVINFELPNVPETYVHRVGRTGRAGAPGIAISLCASDERAYLRDIERLTGTPLERRNGDGGASFGAAREGTPSPSRSFGGGRPQGGRPGGGRPGGGRPGGGRPQGARPEGAQASGGRPSSDRPGGGARAGAPRRRQP